MNKNAGIEIELEGENTASYFEISLNKISIQSIRERFNRDIKHIKYLDTENKFVILATGEDGTINLNKKFKKYIAIKPVHNTSKSVFFSLENENNVITKAATLDGCCFVIDSEVLSELFGIEIKGLSYVDHRGHVGLSQTLSDKKINLLKDINDYNVLPKINPKRDSHPINMPNDEVNVEPITLTRSMFSHFQEMLTKAFRAKIKND